MYDSRIFLNALFCKLHVYNKDVRENVFDLYDELVTTILTLASDTERIEIFKDLLPLFQTTADYFNKIYIKKGQIDNQSVVLMKKLISFYTALFEKYYTEKRRQKVVGDLMKQVNIDEIACNIGEYVVEYKKSKGFHQKVNVIRQLRVLLDDYNSIMRTTLTLRDVITSSLKKR